MRGQEGREEGGTLTQISFSLPFLFFFNSENTEPGLKLKERTTGRKESSLLLSSFRTVSCLRRPSCKLAE